MDPSNSNRFQGVETSAQLGKARAEDARRSFKAQAGENVGAVFALVIVGFVLVSIALRVFGLA